MAKSQSLQERLESEFQSWDKKVESFRAEAVADFEGRENRLKQLTKLLDELREIWRPKLETLAKQFGNKVKVTPNIQPSAREARFSVESELASIELRFWARTDADVRNLICIYDLEIIPTLLDFESKSQISFPLDKVDREALGKWFDDRILYFVQTYFSLYKNEYYLKDHMVEDPVTHVRFPKFAAAATLEQKKKTFYFISEETRQAFEKSQVS